MRYHLGNNAGPTHFYGFWCALVGPEGRNRHHINEPKFRKDALIHPPEDSSS